jgi:hypothetical protein
MKSYLFLVSCLFLGGTFGERALGQEGTPHPAPLPDYENLKQRLLQLQTQFLEFQKSPSWKWDAQRRFHVQSEPEVIPLVDGATLLDCEQVQRRGELAQKKWDTILMLSKQVLSRIESIKSDVVPPNLKQLALEIESDVDAITSAQGELEEIYPTAQFQQLDRIIRYTWTLLPKSIGMETGKGYEYQVVDGSFKTQILSIPGYIWDGAGKVSELATIPEEPFVSGNRIIFERVASPASACISKDPVWLQGSLRVKVKSTPFVPTAFCSLDKGDCPKDEAKSITEENVYSAILFGHLQSHLTLPKTPTLPGAPVCPSQPGKSLDRKPPIYCPVSANGSEP